MQASPTTNTEKGRRAERVLLGVGIFLVLCNCLYMSHVLALDLFGSKANAELTVSSYPCTTNRGKRTCQTADVIFITQNGAEHGFKAGLLPILWDIISPPEDGSSSQTWDVKVRYASFFPLISKVVLPFHLEYLDPDSNKSICGSLKIWIPVSILAVYLYFKRKKANANLAIQPTED